MTAIADPIGMIEARFSIRLKKVGQHEWAGPCPFCGGRDRWHFWTDKLNWWCRPGLGHCGQKGFLHDLFNELKKPTEEQLLEWRIARLEEKQREHERRLSALERMARCKDHVRYHNLLTDEHVEWWHSQGINQDSILEYQLGYCPRCPTDIEGRASYTIPVVNGGQLQNIRHRLANANGGDKYRPHMAGLGLQLFNADFLKGATDIVIVEGAKKSIVLAQHGIPSVAIMGKRAFRLEWLNWFESLRAVYVALDPDARESAYRLAAMFNGCGRVVDLPVKPDDFFFKWGGSVADFENYLKLTRPAKERNVM